MILHEYDLVIPKEEAPHFSLPLLSFSLTLLQSFPL